MPPPLSTDGRLPAMADALAARLKGIFPTSHFAHQIVPAGMTPKVWSDLTARTPFIGLGWRGVEPDPNSGRLFRGRAEWTVFAVVRNPSSPRARLLGDATAPGTIGMAQVAAAWLHGWHVPDCGPIEVQGIAALSADGWKDEAAEVTALNIRVPFTLVGLEQLEDFLRLGVTWEFDPAGNGPVDLLETES